ncbi:response regulator [Halorussus salinisoli]|uniref:response regulator n=1 Tax=Halorussus salinisoli TaxID=2558242 RepID=UPI0010C1C3EB|nr:response regulator [Halorussus salinisoli]
MKTGILIVDDSEFMRQRVKSALADDEYQIVAEAPNGAWAIQKYKENAEDIDLVLMDIVMRKANGLKATAAIKKLDDDVRVIMCTSVGQRQKIQLAARAGADAYITKPFEDDELTDAIDGVVV